MVLRVDPWVEDCPASVQARETLEANVGSVSGIVPEELNTEMAFVEVPPWTMVILPTMK